MDEFDLTVGEVLLLRIFCARFAAGEPFDAPKEAADGSVAYTPFSRFPDSARECIGSMEGKGLLLHRGGDEYAYTALAEAVWKKIYPNWRLSRERALVCRKKRR